MCLYSSILYMEDVCYVARLLLPWDKLYKKTILLSGSTGLIGSFFIDVIMEKNTSEGLDCTVIALSRNMQNAKKRFAKYGNHPNLFIASCDVNYPINIDWVGRIDYVLHLASNTHPVLYSRDPIRTITTNIIGVQHMLDYSVSHHVSRFVFASSNEIYGENRGDVELFEEEYCGYINCNSLRAGYPESKRCGEALCQAYLAQEELDIVIPRFTRTYGPTMIMSDSKAISQFIKKAIAGEDIVLKSEGTQFFSYQYVADSVSGLLTVLLLGERGEAYNIADESNDITLRDLALVIAGIKGKQVVFDIPERDELQGYSVVTKARLCGNKLQELGWKPKYEIKRGVERTIRILEELKQCDSQ